MRAAPPHRLILASAGTGKTFQLSGRFLALLLGGVPPERILATTFTRKAAGEILDRVLRRLVQASEDERELAGLNAQLASEGQPAVDAARCVELLCELAHGLHRFRIRTLDAFFAQLAGVFALELGLPAGWRILEEDEKLALQREALSDALADADTVDVLELLRALQKTGAARSVERSLLQTVKEGRDAYLDSRAPAWDRIHVPPGLDDDAFEAALRGLEAMDLPKTKKGAPDKRWINGRGELLEAIRRESWEGALGKGLPAKLLKGEADYCGHPITDEHLAVLKPLMNHAAHVLLGTLRRQNLASRAWLEAFETSFASRKASMSGLSFEDVPRALAPPEEQSLAARGFDLGYRLDGRVDHLLLDEFQDTAPPQWRVLAPLAEEILAEGDGVRSFFCVGDVKQAIYAWRSGEPRLLSGMAQRYPMLPGKTELTRNWRSSPVVLETVDRVFESIGSSAALTTPPQLAAAESFEREYAPHEAARDLPGAALLLVAEPPDEGESGDLPPLRLAAERVAELAREAPHATIAVLLRRNSLQSRMIDLLRRQGLRASGEGGNPLTDSSAVLHALSALHLADHPGDRAAAFHVASSPLGAAFGAEEDDFRAPVALSRRLRERLSRGGFGEFLAEAMPAVAESDGYGPWDAKRFAQLVDLGYAFDRREELRAGAFLDYVRETRVEDPSSTQVKVMTIHASKGLEFDVVLLPELDLGMTIREASILRSRPEPDGDLAGVSASRSSMICELDPDGLAAIRLEEDTRHVQEALCLLYVAMTRAAHRLELIVKDGTARASSYAAVLYGSLASTPGGDVGELGVPRAIWCHPDSSSKWWPAVPEHGDELAAAAEGEAVLPRFAAGTASRDLRRKSPSAEEGGHALDVNDLLRPSRGRGFTRGTLIHRWLQEIEWLDDFDADAGALDAMGIGIERDAEARAEAFAAFCAAIEQPDVSALLTRPAEAEPGDVEVWRERDFAEIVEEDEEAVLWTGSFDRVVLHRVRGELVRAEVIDYKTDRVKPGGVDARAEFYTPQLESYRRVLARMTGLEPSAIEGLLVFLESGVVRRTNPGSAERADTPAPKVSSKLPPRGQGSLFD